eukprot:GAHX01000110.1.p1 GENE.GAHX01000110.1~~GAHX01000110.1.p1  ORF type:complete len:422 (+),score=79.51 GAHX01000110.1:829-2094(+)
MICSLVFSDNKGNRIVDRDYTGGLSQSVTSHVETLCSSSNFVPIVQIGEYTFISVKLENIFITCILYGPINTFIPLTFMHRLSRTLYDIFKSGDENSLLDNIFFLYEILDEVIFSGVPQYSSAQETLNILKNSPTLDYNKLERRYSLSFKDTNELFIDHYELIDIILDSDGKVVQSNVRGKLDATSNLAGNPLLKINFKENFVLPSSFTSKVKKLYRKNVNDYTDIGAVRFHESVRLDGYGSESSISLLPPPGSFEFMSYRYNYKIKPVFYVTATSDVKEQSAKLVVSLRSGYKRNVVATKLKVKIPVSSSIKKVAFKEQVGVVTYKATNDLVEWEMFNFEGERDVCLVCDFVLNTAKNKEEERAIEKEFKKSIYVEFEIPSYTVSGFGIKNIFVTERSGYTASPFLNYSTRNGVYEIRIK